MDEDQLAQQLVEATHLFMRHLWVEIREAMAEDFPLPHYRLIGMLAKRSWTLKELASAQRVSAPTVSRAIRLLAERGLVVSERDKTDRRLVWIRLTPRGQTQYRRLQACAVTGARRFLAHLTPGERRRLFAALHLLHKMIEAERRSDERD